MSYIAHASEYENPVIAAMDGPEAVYVPTWTQDMSDASNEAYIQLLSKAIEASMTRVNCEYPWAFIAFSEYLHDKYKVPAVDCDFLVQLFNGSLGDAIDKVTNHLARVQAREFDTYIDWDRYFADHPEFKKGD